MARLIDCRNIPGLVIQPLPGEMLIASSGGRFLNPTIRVTEGRLNDLKKWSAPLSLRLLRLLIRNSQASLTTEAKPVYLKSDSTSPMTSA